MLTPMAWAFTRISVLGVCRYLDNVDEVNSPRFLFVCSGMNITKKKKKIKIKKLKNNSLKTITQL